MSYLERSTIVIAEMGKRFMLNRGAIVGRSERTTVTAVGSYRSDLYGGVMHIALKELARPTTDVTDLIYNLVYAEGIYDKVPELQSEFPFFKGMLQTKGGAYLGIITEDLTKGGMYRLKPVVQGGLSKDELPLKSLRTYLTGRNGSVGWDELANMFFYVQRDSGKWVRKIADFDKTSGGIMLPGEILEIFPVTKVLDNADKYTLRLPYDFR